MYFFTAYIISLNIICNKYQMICKLTFQVPSNVLKQFAKYYKSLKFTKYVLWFQS